ncbi:MFS transporter [Aquincola sp. S2]|uniref:MFS transporter n=1 Tax=Pseudaquabacterium terrae TaxID=2732868 RepID=A0ABX2EFX3_9BURK|nr:MFS transporter [Aquabacterium terrae]NRF67498.1 MFS transporter [Aquabacterium terrae]
MSSIEPVLPRPVPGILSPPFRAMTIGMLALISLLAFEQLAVATVMPVVATALGDASLYAAAFGVALAAGIVGMVLAGRWSDRAGPAPALWAGIAAFVLGLAAAGTAPTMPALVLGRALQGMGGGLMGVALYVVVGQHYPSALHARIFAAFAAAWVLPAIVGPALAGLMERHFGWRWVFLAAALLALPSAAMVWRGLVAGARPAPARPQDVQEPRAGLGPAALAAVSAGLLYAGGQSAAGHAAVVAAALVGLALSAPRLLPHGTFTARHGLPAVIGLRGLAAAAFVTAEVFIPLMLTRERGLTPVQAGLVLTIGALGWSAGSWLQGRSTRPRSDAACVRLLRMGLGSITLGVAAVTLVLLPAVPLAVAVVGWAITGLGMGLVFPTLSVLMLRLAPGAKQGAASSALQLSDSLVSAVGLALAGLLLAALQQQTPTGAFVAGFAVAAGLSALGLAVAGRARAGRPAVGAATICDSPESMLDAHQSPPA